ncbi:MAG: hypothetical protein FWD23_17880 [Oscillospiraceae bacterium]|nr:hypothetical protein [Oscillospiraceae bacterium]
MSAISQEIIKMVDMLPEQDQSLAFEIIKKLVLAWDPDYTKVTPSEFESIRIGMEQIDRGEVISHNDINWN